MAQPHKIDLDLDLLAALAQASLGLEVLVHEDEYLVGVLPGNPLYTTEVVYVDADAGRILWASEQEAPDSLWGWLMRMGFSPEGWTSARRGRPYYEYVGLLWHLHQLIAAGQDDTPEGAALRELMDEPWDAMTAAEVEEVKNLSERWFRRPPAPATSARPCAARAVMSSGT